MGRERNTGHDRGKGDRGCSQENEDFCDLFFESHGRTDESAALFEVSGWHSTTSCRGPLATFPHHVDVLKGDWIKDMVTMGLPVEECDSRSD